jgi:superfamily II DNA or RNA helicase
MTASAITLRPYQAEAVAAVLAEFKRVRSTLLVLPTGAGKTATASEIIRRGYAAGRSILWLAHRQELIEQAATAIERASGCTVQVEMAERSEASDAPALFDRGSGRVVVASAQSMVRRLHKFPADSFDLIINDECHHAAAAGQTKILEHFGTAKRLGITATPERGDKKSLGKLFESVAYDLSLFDAIDGGWLVPIRQVRVDTDIDFSEVRTRAGDFAVSDLSEVMSRLDSLRAVSGPLVKHLGGRRQALVFCVDVGHTMLQAESIREAMRELGVDGRVEIVTGETPADARTEVFDAFRRGDVTVLVNCMIATEGTDLPTCSLIAMARPTKSRVLYSQMRGRALRPLPGLVDGLAAASARRAAIAASAKPYAVVLDFAGNFDRHEGGVCDSLDGLLDDDDPDADEVRTILKRGDTDDLMEAIRRARELRAGRDRAKLARDGDLFALFGIVRESDRWGREMTAKQREVLVPVVADSKREGDPLAGYDLRSASQAVSEIIRRRKAGLCNYKQARALVRWRVPVEVAAATSFVAASRLLDYAVSQKPRVSEWWASVAT